MAGTYDVVITGGTVVDGSGAPGFRADVGVRDGVIAEVAPEPATRHAAAAAAEALFRGVVAASSEVGP